MLRAFVMILGLAVGASGARPKSDPASFETAKRWLRAVASADMGVLTKSTALPFTFATTAKVKRCERAVADQKGLSSWLTCLQKSDKLLIDEAREGTLMPSDPLNVESKSLRELGSKVASTGKWIETFINGDGVTYTFRFLIVGDSVAAFLVDAEIEGG